MLHQKVETIIPERMDQVSPVRRVQGDSEVVAGSLNSQLNLLHVITGSMVVCCSLGYPQYASNVLIYIIRLYL